MILEPEAWRQAEEEFHLVHRGSYREEEVTQFIFFSLIVKELRQQNELLRAIAGERYQPEDAPITDHEPYYMCCEKHYPPGSEQVKRGK